MVDWLNFSESSGSGYQLVSVTALPNYGNNRTTSFVVSGNTIVRNIEVEQEAYAITIDPLKYTFDYTGGTHSFTIISGKDWSITNYPSWLTLSALSGGSGTTIITATAERNETSSMLSSTIVVTNQTSSASTDVYQDRKNELNSYLTFTITSPGVITWSYSDDYSDLELPRSIYYNKNNTSWTELISSTAGSSFNVTTGDVICFRGDNSTYGEIVSGPNGDRYIWNTFKKSTASFDLSGNIMSLVNSTNFSGITTLTGSLNFYAMFSNTSGVTDAKDLILPATTLTKFCYGFMFNRCTNLTTAPELPATTLAEFCYEGMFERCTSLTTAPELPATTLAPYCYSEMFSGCTSLTTAPELPATTLVSSCYESMFRGCSSLNYIKCLATDRSARYCTYYWVNGVANSGTFVKASSTTWETGRNGIPSGWTVEDA